jgi:hypothetical protein
MLRVLFDFVGGCVIKPTWRPHFRLPPFAENAKERGTLWVDDASEIA